MRGELAPRLVVGQRVRLSEGAPILTVERVTYTAAYVRVESTRLVEIRDDDGNVTRSFEARESGSLAISPTSLVWEA